MRPARSPSPFSARRRPLPSGGAGAVKAAPAPSAARGALTGGARCAAILLFRLAGLGFHAARAPLGAAGARAPPAASASRVGFTAEGEDGDGAGWAGGQTPKWAPRAGSASRAGFAAEARARRPTARAARERSDQAGVWGRLAPMSKRCLAAQPAAGAVRWRRFTSRRTDQSAAGCADWQYRYDQSGASHCPPPPTRPARQRTARRGGYQASAGPRAGSTP